MKYWIILILLAAAIGCENTGTDELTDCDLIYDCYGGEEFCSDDFADGTGSCGKIFNDLVNCIDENGCDYSCECNYSNFKMACGD